MGNEISGRQTEVSNKYGIDLDELRKWYHEHYINFLKKEISDKTWQNDKYEKHMKDDSGRAIRDGHKQFCKWKEIQKEIFEAVLDNHRFLLYTWEERAKKFIDEAQEAHFNGKQCDNDDKKTQDDESSGSTTTTRGIIKSINLKGCLPKRRDIINKRLRDMKNYIHDMKTQYENTNGSIMDTIIATTVIGRLALQTQNEIENLMKEKRSNMEHVCKLYRRTFADYKDISKGADIVNHYVSQDVQGLLKGISEKVGETKMDDLWKKFFKGKIEEKLQKLETSKNGSTAQKSCTLDHSDEKSPQCLRYMEEYLEEFLEQKRLFEWFLENRCKHQNSLNDNNCIAHCTNYKNFLNTRKGCYQTYKSQCQKNLKIDTTYSDDRAYKAEIDKIERLIKDKSGCGDTCGTVGNVNLEPLFDLTNSSTNKSYVCNCNGNGRKSKPPCNQTASSKKLTLKGHWRQGIHSRHQSKPSDACSLQFGDHNSVGGGGADPCHGVPSGSEWKCEDTFEEGICLPPRRHEICISNIRNLKSSDISGINSDKLLLELMLAAKSQAWRIRNNKHKDRQSTYIICRDIELSSYDFEDIIKGTDKAKDEYSVDVENNLKAIFEKIRDEWKKGNDGDTKYDDTTAFDGLKKLRSDWWDENKNDIWEAFKCGNSCGSAVPQDSRSQFLRWFEEWATEFCNERKNKEYLVARACESCGDNECSSTWTSWWSSLFSPMYKFCDCKNQCREYSNWIGTQKKQFDTQSKYYDEKITSMDFGINSSVTITRGSSPSVTSTTSSSVPNVATYLKDTSKRSCTDIDFSKTDRIFSSYPDERSQYRHKCSKCYAQQEADLTGEDGNKKMVCGVNKILTREDSNITHNCDGKSTKTNDGKEWSTKDISKQYSGSNGHKFAVPPRYEDICKDTITNNTVKDERMSSHNYYYNNRMLLSEFILVAQHEGKSLREHYRGKSDNSVVCTSIRRSFADIGDIVKGTNIVDTENNNQVEKHLKEMFNKLRDEYHTFAADKDIYGYDDAGLSLFRKNWWEMNRHMIWEAFNCDRLNKECAKHNDIDKVPQLLRWLGEWSEDFYEQRQKKIEDLKNTCTTCKMDSNQNQQMNSQKCNPKNKCETCQEKCNDYKAWIKNWKEQWEIFKKYYDEQKEKNDNEFKNYVTSDDLSQYVVNKLKHIGFNNINTFDENDAFANYPSAYQKVCSCDYNDTSSPSGRTNDENTCNDNFKSQWNCDDATGSRKKTKRNMCVRNDDNVDINISNNGDMLFFNSFTKWLDEISYSMHENTNTLSQTCNRNIIVGTNNSTGNKEGCEECQKNCKCYEKWKEKITEQWKRQRTYFEEEKKKKGSTMNDIDLNDFLYAYCWTKDEKRTEKECSSKGKDKTIIDEKLEETNTRNTNACDICPDKNKGKQDSAVHNCDSSGMTALKGYCTKKEYDNIKANTINYEKDWKEAQNVNNKIDKFYVPPRRQQLCISYLKDNGDISDEQNLKNILIKTIRSETEKLYEYYQTKNTNAQPVNSDNNKQEENNLPLGFCNAVERSFADIGDFVKGSDLDYTQGDTTEVKTKMDNFFQDKSKITVDRNTWWENNKRGLWKEVKCGINGGASTGLQCPQNLDFDRRDQFLRWFAEWGEYVCKEHTKELAKLTNECEGCNNDLKCGTNTGSNSGGATRCNNGNCTTACEKYKAWIQKRRNQWIKLLINYKEKQSQYNDDEDEATFWAKHMPASTYLKFFNTDTCSKTLFNKLFYEKYDYGDQQNLCECNEHKKNTTMPSDEDDSADEKIQADPCDYNITTNVSSCHGKKFDGVVWTSRNIRTDKNGKPMFGVYAPPRRQKLCVGNIWQHATNKSTLLNELLLAAKTEAKYLKDYYNKKNGEQRSSKNNELCKAITRSFYDLGDIIKGTDLSRGAIVTATENKIHSIFKDELSSSGSRTTTVSDGKILDARKTWWESNKTKVWKALNCNNTCTTTAPNDSTPQFLRWYEEWYEDFCKHRKQLLDNIIEKCNGKGPDEQCDDTDTLCTDSCSKYSNWLTPKQFEWIAQKKNYQRKKDNEHMEEIEFQNVTKGKNKLEEYLKDKYESNNGSCKHMDVQKMDEIVVKNDDDYKTKYEPLCSRCRMKKLIDKANEKINERKQKPSAPDRGGGSGNRNPGTPGGEGQRGTKEDICKNVETYISHNEAQTGNNRCKDKVDVEWDCAEKAKSPVPKDGSCMPPRRQKMCVKYLKELKGNESTDKLKETFIKCASIETYLAWKKYIQDKGKEKPPTNADKLENQLKQGIIPEEFKRQMIYSFVDFKDMCLGKDMGNDDGKKVSNNVKSILKNEKNGIYKNKNDDEKPQELWKEIEEKVWEAMVCSLSYNGSTMDAGTQKKLGENNKYSDVKFSGVTKLSEFVKRPQFLRWLTEWSEEFCKTQKKHYDEVASKCGSCTASECKGNCTTCKAKCAEYKNEVARWKVHWEKQQTKYEELYKKIGATTKAGTNSNDQQVIDHLKTLSNGNTKYNSAGGYLKEQGYTKNCDDSNQNDFSTISGNNYSFNDYPNNYKDACKCDPNASKHATPRGSNNPCANPSGITPTKTIEDIAKEMQEEAKTQMETKSVVGGTESILKGNASQGTYHQNGLGRVLENGNICAITDKHSNDKRVYVSDYQGPCTGKGGNEKERLLIGKKWTTRGDVDDEHKGVLFPPRRLDMCTSNLENLKTEYEGLTNPDKAKHSLLGDVMLAAKEEAQSIIDLYKEKNSLNDLKEQKHKDTVCRAMKASFADIGDIIRGRDIWTKETGNKDLQENLKKIFKKIKENTGLTTIYNEDSPYTQLRNDWWEANRDQIWKAMKCAGKTDNLNGDCQNNSVKPPPLDDYIPQKLRWLTEWSEWYCKRQSQLYKDLESKCGGCKNGGTNVSCSRCPGCKDKCQEYEKIIKEWEKDWKEQQKQYLKYYQEAQNSGGNDENEKYLYKFLKQLKQHNKANNIYDSAEGYIQQELKNGNVCEKQNEFCETKNGGTNNDKYTFLTQPSGYEQACACDSKTPCDIVKETLNKKDETKGNIEGCNPKTLTGNDYPKWKCEDDQFEPGHKDACIPPRRQKLCVHYLKELKNGGQKELKEAFIKTAAAETFLHWQYYKEYGLGKDRGTDLDNELKGGSIPEEFKRQMMYTFGDLRDLCLNKDISKKTKTSREKTDVGTARDNIDNVFKKNGQPSGQVDETKRENWWNSNAQYIWEGMLCGLSHAGGNDEKTRNEVKQKLDANNYGYDKVTFSGTTTPSSGSPSDLAAFASRPQFLRWMTEWGEHYCREYTREFTTLHQKCGSCTSVNGTGSSGKATCITECTECKKQCGIYKTWIQTWQKHYTSQKEKYTKVKEQQDYKNADTDVSSSKEAYDYLSKKIKKICNGGNIIKCDCMEQRSKQNTSSGIIPESLDEKPESVKDKCDCTTSRHPNPPKPMPNPNPGAPSGTGTQCEIEKYVTENKQKGSGGCNEKHFDKKSWNCDSQIDSSHNGACMSPRRQSLCIHYLSDVNEKDKIKTEEQLKTAVIKSASLETYWLWKKYIDDKKKEEKTKGGNASEELQKQLKEQGKIPPDFLRTMFYTYSDFHDLIVGKDLGIHSGNTAIRPKVTEILDKEQGGKYKGNHKQWWKTIEEQVWNAMICSLTHQSIGGNKDITTKNEYKYGTVTFDGTTKLDKFSDRPQFLRWLTEWGEDVCKQRGIKIKELEDKCKLCTNLNTCDKCGDCKTQCGKYKNWLTTWRYNYTKQSGKYSQVKEQQEYKDSDDDVKTSEHAYQYLYKKIKKFCSTNNKSIDCECMKDLSKEPNSSSQQLPQTLDEKPDSVKDMCDCTTTPKPSPAPHVPTPNKNSACATISSELKNLSQYQMECNELRTATNNNYTCQSKRYLTGEDIKLKISKKNKDYVPTRTKQLCMNHLIDLSNNSNNTVSNNVKEKDFSEALQKDAYNEAQLLSEYYKANNNILGNDGSALKDEKINEYTLQAMKRSYADYGDLIKGITQYDYNGEKKKISELINTKLNNLANGKRGEELWNKYKSDVWNSMLCGFFEASKKKPEKDMCKLPETDSENQFLRWFTEWAEHFCFHKDIEINKLQNHCSFNKCDDASSHEINICLNSCKTYNNFINRWEQEYTNQHHTYENLEKEIHEMNGKDTPTFLSKKCGHKCSCFNNKDVNTVDVLFQNPPDAYADKCKCTSTPKKAHPSNSNSNNNDAVPSSGGDKSLPKQEDEFKDLDECPFENGGSGGSTTINNEKCKNLNENILCMKKYANNLNEWTILEVNENQTKNKGVIVPPRRRNLCFRHVTSNYRQKSGKDKFKSDILKTAFTHGKLLGQMHKANQNLGMKNMKYSYADIADIVKGTDMLDDHISKKLNKLFGINNGNPTREQWWENNKKKVWHAMLCGYKQAGGTIETNDCTLPQEDKTTQFLRWLEEWASVFCNQKKKEAEQVVNKCFEKNEIQNATKISDITDSTCKNVLEKYRDWYIERNTQWEGLKEQYKKYKSRHANSSVPSSVGSELQQDAEAYVTEICAECDCNYKDLESIFKKKEEDTKLFGELIKTAANDGSFSIHQLNPIYNLIQNISTIATHAIQEVIPNPKKFVEDALQNVVDNTFKGLARVNKAIKDIKEQQKKRDVDPPKPLPDLTPILPRKPVLPTTDILSSTVPVGISFALGSIALLFYLKKKPKTSAVDLVRVLDIPQNDYNIPDETSTNRYVPYSKYKGKTYIYVERDGDSEDDKYMFTSDTTDVTSSESEYEELDINDIYPYKSPKYKTLIEVILKPTKSGDTTNSGDIPSDIPSNKFTDDEWNELKENFISQYLQNDNMELPNENIIDDNMNMEPNIIPNSMEEKPFITQIQDRKLYSDDNEIIYNIDWNIPNNISTNTPTYNSLYSGIDLINDSLNSGNNIYDELLKRKENELFGTKHPKNTSTNSFSKKTNSDPILNQIDLFDKWLDRHRDMCNQWNNKEEMLHKLKDEWNKENNQNIMNISSTHNDMNDQTYNVRNTHESNDITFVDKVASTYNTSNDLQTNNLRTNIYMDIHYNENNDIPSNDNLENSYNSS
ncbi:erythrocyte membrane protein 1, PfEMP1, putative [Plasmodium sp. gorilla clade G2]|uniref:erythrocyte membrane protein 1, PfEMP1, putative n=1 Tax=Plasmodium sp. gorilla clade G2 TaxID=880535 RepID=UPI000D280ABF|nr:erythrocyte membrane protein 1, PfEMP1, putative [Plasmodium sp. gorilla clade G2]SOV20414.1 erythrocyte membrane protein 1, PfEMP1, putative [Plasmodium sp. gorilla clade G2]